MSTPGGKLKPLTPTKGDDQPADTTGIVCNQQSTVASIDTDVPQTESSFTTKPSLSKRPSIVTLSCGTNVNLLDFDLPHDIHDFLVDLDFDRSGTIDKEELDGLKNLLATIHKHLDGHDPDEIHKGIEQLGKLMAAKLANADDIDYTHMPERAQKVLRKWDEHKTGKVTCEMLQKAAIAEEHMANQNKIMRRIVCVLALMCLGLLIAIFPLVFAANEAAKEMHVEEGGQMKNLDGTIVSVASSDFEVNAEGKMVLKSRTGRRLSQGTCDGSGNGTCDSSVLKTAASFEGITDFASTLPDETFQEMDKLTLNVGEAVETFPISSFKRVKVRSAKCGSLVYLEVAGGHGHFILDDTILSVDDKLAVYLEDFPFELEEHQGMGRRLAKTDGMLKGFFNMIAGMEQTCTSQPLEAPDVLGGAFNTKAQVVQVYAGNPESTMSQWFFDSKGNPFPMPSYRVTYGPDGTINASYRTWDELTVQGNGLEAYLESSVMQPYTKGLRIKDSRGEVFVTIQESQKAAFDCIVRERAMDDDPMEDGSDEMKLTFIGLKTEGHLILRHYRLFMLQAAIYKEEQVRLRRLAAGQAAEEGDDQVNGTELLRQMILVGEIPEYLDYFDVDTDQTGKRDPGSPYRLTHDSSVKPNTCYRSKTFLEIEPIEHDVTIASILNRFGIKYLSQECRHGKNESAWTAESLALKDEFVQNLALNESMYSPKFVPSKERLSSIEFTYEKLLADCTANPGFVEDLRRRDPVWDFVLRQDIDDFRALLNSDLDEESSSSNSSGNSSVSVGRRLGIQEAPGYHEITQRDLISTRGRRLGAEARRLGNFKCKLERYYAGKGDQVFDFILDLNGKAELDIQINTNGANQITYIHGQAWGCVPIWKPPTLSVCLGGGIYWQHPTVGGFISFGVELKVLLVEVGLRLNLYASLNYQTKRLASVAAELEVKVGKMLLYFIVTAEPTGCGSNYYRQWDMTISFRAKYTGRPKFLRFDKTWEIISFEVGRGGCR